MKILIIDDDRLTLVAVSKKLQNAGHEVSTLDNGVKALEVIKDNNFDLILSDIMMPGISGLELLNILKCMHLSKIPVILISALQDKNLITQSLELGAFDYIVKPINFNELLTKMDRLKEQKIDF